MYLLMKFLTIFFVFILIISKAQSLKFKNEIIEANYDFLEFGKNENFQKKIRKLYQNQGKDYVINRAVEMIARYEDFSSVAYWDHGGYSIGYGSRSKKGATVTEAVAKKWLENHVKAIYDKLDVWYPDNHFTDNQKIALISYRYNCAYYQTSVWRYNNGYSDLSIANAMKASCRTASGKILKGLIKRRNEEFNLFIY